MTIDEESGQQQAKLAIEGTVRSDVQCERQGVMCGVAMELYRARALAIEGSRRRQVHAGSVSNKGQLG